MVYAHGSEAIGWIGAAREPLQLVARGISVFVYDKRGTGQSEGQYTQNFPLLAEDQDAPIAKTLSRLTQLKQQGRSITIEIIPNTDHGMWLLGESKISSDYFDMQAEYIKHGSISSVKSEL